MVCANIWLKADLTNDSVETGWRLVSALLSSLKLRLQSLFATSVPFSNLFARKRERLARNVYPADEKDRLSKHLAALASLNYEDIMPALAALPKDLQDAILARLKGRMDSRIASGDHDAETVAVGYREQLDHIYPDTTLFDHVM